MTFKIGLATLITGIGLAGMVYMGFLLARSAYLDYVDPYFGPHGMMTVPAVLPIPLHETWYLGLGILGETFVTVDPLVTRNQICFAMIYNKEELSDKRLPANLNEMYRRKLTALCVMCLTPQQLDHHESTEGQWYMPGGYRASDLGKNASIFLGDIHELAAPYECIYQSDRYPASETGFRILWVVIGAVFYFMCAGGVQFIWSEKKQSDQPLILQRPSEIPSAPPLDTWGEEDSQPEGDPEEAIEEGEEGA